MEHANNICIVAADSSEKLSQQFLVKKTNKQDGSCMIRDFSYFLGSPTFCAHCRLETFLSLLFKYSQ